MAKVVRPIKAALFRIEAEISVYAKGGFYAAGLSGEGYQGGYRDALHDVLLLLGGTRPNRRGWWEDDD